MRPLPIFVATLATLATPGCQSEPVLGVESASIVVSPVPNRPAAGYFVLKGGPVDEVLEFASVPYAGRTEMHETVNADGRMSMRGIERVPVPSGSTLRFEPGGKHLMIYRPQPDGTERRSHPARAALLRRLAGVLPRVGSHAGATGRIA